MTTARAQSTPLAAMLLIGMVVTGMALVVAVGGQALNEARETVDQQRAEKVMTQLASNSALVALGDSERQEISLSSTQQGDYDVHTDAGWIRVLVINQSSGESKVNTNVSLGAIVYESGTTEMALQGGGVWRQDRGNVNTTRMVSPPEAHYRNGSLTLPIVSISRGDSDVPMSGSAVITKNGSSDTQFPNPALDDDWVNPLDDHKVVVTVSGDYYRGWGTFFEQRTQGDVEYSHAENVVNLTLLTTTGDTSLDSGVSAQASGSKLFIVGNNINDPCGGSSYYTNSYNSSDDGEDGNPGTEDDYCDEHSDGTLDDKGNLTYGGNINLQSAATIHGTIKSGDEITVGSSSSVVHNDIFWSDSCTDHDGNPGTGCEQYLNDGDDKAEAISGIDTGSDISRHVRTTVEDIEDEQGGTSNDKNAITSDVTLNNGERYYADRVVLQNGETLTIDTTSGDVTLAVEEFVDIEPGGHIDVQGDNAAKIYINGTELLGSAEARDDDDSDEDADDDEEFLEIETDTHDTGKVTVPHDNAPQLYVYGNKSFNASLTGHNQNNNARFEGAIYAPTGSSGTGRVNISHGVVRGAVVTGDVSLQGNLLYDQALGTQQAVSNGAQVVAITYLHVSVNRIDVAGGHLPESGLGAGGFPIGATFTKSGNSLIQINGDGESTKTISSTTNVGGTIGGPPKDIDGDGDVDLPYVTSGDTVKMVDANGNTVVVAESSDIAGDTIESQTSRIATGTWDGTGPSVFFVGENHDKIYRSQPGSSTTEVIDPGDGAQSVVGVGDIDGDGDDELVFGDGSQTLQYVNPDDTVATTGASTGSNDGIGTGSLGDFDGGGDEEVSVVDGGNNLQLVDSGGETTIESDDVVGSSAPQAKKAPTAAADVDDDGETELVYVGNDNGNMKYIDNLDEMASGNAEIKFLNDGEGNKISGDSSTGTT